MDPNKNTPPNPFKKIHQPLTSMEQLFQPATVQFDFEQHLDDASLRLKNTNEVADEDDRTPIEMYKSWNTAAEKCRDQLIDVVAREESLSNEDKEILEQFKDQLDSQIKKYGKASEDLVKKRGKILVQHSDNPRAKNLLEQLSEILEEVLKDTSKPVDGRIQVLKTDMIPRVERVIERLNDAK